VELAAAAGRGGKLDQQERQEGNQEIMSGKSRTTIRPSSTIDKDRDANACVHNFYALYIFCPYGLDLRLTCDCFMPY